MHESAATTRAKAKTRKTNKIFDPSAIMYKVTTTSYTAKVFKQVAMEQRLTITVLPKWNGKGARL